jgi:uncharacterized DUF497 family protein
MIFEWDDKKNRNNIEKHGISFMEACEVFQYSHLTVRDDRFEYGEIREVSTGKIAEDIIIVVVHTIRGKKIRIISARKANTREKERYDDYIKTKTQ